MNSTVPTPDSEPEHLEVALWVKVLMVIYLLTIHFFGVASNVIVAIVYGRTSPKSACDWLILTISITDALVCFCSPVLYVRSYLRIPLPWKTSFVCTMEYWLQLTAMFASCMLLTIIAQDRYVKICRPALFSFTPVMARNACVITPLVSAVICLVPFLGRMTDSHCYISEIRETKVTKAFFTCMFCCFLVSFCIVTFAYISICQKISQKIKIKQRLIEKNGLKLSTEQGIKEESISHQPLCPNLCSQLFSSWPSKWKISFGAPYTNKTRCKSSNESLYSNSNINMSGRSKNSSDKRNSIDDKENVAFLNTDLKINISTSETVSLVQTENLTENSPNQWMTSEAKKDPAMEAGSQSYTTVGGCTSHSLVIDSDKTVRLDSEVSQVADSNVDMNDGISLQQHATLYPYNFKTGDNCILKHEKGNKPTPRRYYSSFCLLSTKSLLGTNTVGITNITRSHSFALPCPSQSNGKLGHADSIVMSSCITRCPGRFKNSAEFFVNMDACSLYRLATNNHHQRLVKSDPCLLLRPNNENLLTSSCQYRDALHKTVILGPTPDPKRAFNTNYSLIEENATVQELPRQSPFSKVTLSGNLQDHTTDFPQKTISSGGSRSALQLVPSIISPNDIPNPADEIQQEANRLEQTHAAGVLLHRPRSQTALKPTGSTSSWRSNKSSSFADPVKTLLVVDATDADDRSEFLSDVPTSPSAFRRSRMKGCRVSTRSKSSVRSTASSKIRFDRERQITLMLLSVTAAFLLSWVPPWVMYMTSLYGPVEYSQSAVIQYLETIHLLNYVSSPVIYFTFNPTFRSKITLMLLSVTAAFVLSWVPPWVMYMTSLYGPVGYSQSAVIQYLETIHLLNYVSSPVIYFTFNPTLRSKITLMLLSVTAAFLLSWVPPWLMYMTSLYAPMKYSKSALIQYLGTIHLLNYVASPVIYFTFNPTFRSKVSQLLAPSRKLNCCCGKDSSQPHPPEANFTRI